MSKWKDEVEKRRAARSTKALDIINRSVANRKLPSSIFEGRDSEKEFLALFHQLTRTRSPWTVWQDFVLASACAISNTLDEKNAAIRDKMYLETVAKYERSEAQIISHLLAETVMSLEINPEQDFLGRIFMRLELGNDHAGQFFTPYDVSKLMSELTANDVMATVKDNGYVTIHDPCCGAGATMIAGVMTAKKELDKAGMNFQNHILAIGQDIDQTVGLMCYIQLSLLGVAGYVKIGNSLIDCLWTDEDSSKCWFTPIYFHEIWKTRRILKALNNIFEGGAEP